MPVPHARRRRTPFSGGVCPTVRGTPGSPWHTSLRGPARGPLSQSARCPHSSGRESRQDQHLHSKAPRGPAGCTGCGRAPPPGLCAPLRTRPEILPRIRREPLAPRSRSAGPGTGTHRSWPTPRYRCPSRMRPSPPPSDRAGSRLRRRAYRPARRPTSTPGLAAQRRRPEGHRPGGAAKGGMSQSQRLLGLPRCQVSTGPPFYGILSSSRDLFDLSSNEVG